MTQLAVVGLVAFIASLLLTPFVRKLAVKQGVIDQPGDPRRVHKEPTPRWGGLAIFAGVVIATGVGFLWLHLGPHGLEARAFLGLLIVATAVMVMGALDDKYEFSAFTQLGFLLACGVIVQLFGVQITGITNPFGGGWMPISPWLAWPLTAIWMFVITKTMDTIDGLDGLAAGISAISAATIALMGQMSGMLPVAVLAAAVSGASLGFLRHNYNPAKIFMGTGGAQFLGFVLAGLSVIGAFKFAAVVSVGVPILIFGLPIIDAFYVVIRRLQHKQPIYRADKRHIHHHLISSGLTHRQTVLVMYAVALFLCATALWIFGKGHDVKQQPGTGAAFGNDRIWDPAGRHQDGAGDQGAGALPEPGLS